ncbi:dienelactone hydrolase family protein [Adhaeribacter swui]|uniref:Dienelactone hydrolase family protein n=1 Tax=Adhaeribacter swui TaxID=2086471 RepID=A0A7G7GAH1_9BACT|nr:dienelactone hydrolase family protein [Adhaeribacter swui]QNF34155.1 dienelactone hydrolase family protein [Adhaeribacter swui]
MKKLYTVLFLLISLIPAAWAQHASCCTKPSEVSQTFAMLVSTDKKFVLDHANPLPYKHQSEVGQMITFKTPDGQAGNGYELKAIKKTNNYLFVYQEWWGLNDHIKKEAESYYNDLKQEVNVIAVDLYDGKVAANRENAMKYVQAVKPARLENIIKGAQTYAGPQAKIASVGWCFGGMWSLQSAIITGKQNVGCVMFYGMPEKDVNRLKTLNSDVLGFFATEKMISEEVVKQFDANMKQAGKKLTYKIYDAPHAFANPSNPDYNKQFATETHQQAVKYFMGKFKLKA